MPAAAPSPLSPRLAPEAFELDPDRASAILELEVLRDVFDRHVGVVPHLADVRELHSNVGQTFLRRLRGQAFLELAK